MNITSDSISLRKPLMLWTVLTVILFVAAFYVSIYVEGARSFVFLLNALNAVLIMTIFVFRKNIERGISYLILKSSEITVSTNYKYESSLGAFVVFVFSIFCIYTLYLAFFDVKQYARFIDEDGVVEYASSLFWFLSALLTIAYTLKLSRAGLNRYQLLVNFLMILFFIVCSGEEISWGQRVLNIETPDLLKSVNVQNELNLHNIGSISVFSNVFFLITITFFLIIPYFSRKSKQFRKVLYFSHFPVVNKFPIYIYILTLIVWIAVGIRFGTLGFHPYSFYQEEYYTQMDDEIFELLASYSFFCFAIFQYVKDIKIVKEDFRG